MTAPEGARLRTRDAIRKCAEWLAFCIRIGWRHDELDFLESLWWKYHDERGVLIRRGVNGNKLDELMREG